MPKRKSKTTADDDDSGSDVQIVNVDFEFFDPSQVDYIALKRLINQLFQLDAEYFHPHELADLVISQPLLGTTVKTDGKDSDPLAFLTVLNMNVHKDHPSIKAIVSYLLAKASSNPSLQAFLNSILGPEALSSEKHVGLLLGDRLINMPVEILPPMYRLLSDEMQWAIEENEPYTFDHYIIISRVYRLTAEDEANMAEGAEPIQPANKKAKGKKQKGRNSQPTGGTFTFHPEDETIMKVASHSMDYDFSNRQPRDGSDAFGLDTAGRMMVIPASQFPPLVQLLSESHPAPGA